jgi:hypothetical protein
VIVGDGCSCCGPCCVHCCWGQQDYQVGQQQGDVVVKSPADLQRSCCLPLWLSALLMPRLVSRYQCPPRYWACTVWWGRYHGVLVCQHAQAVPGAFITQRRIGGGRLLRGGQAVRVYGGCHCRGSCTGRCGRLVGRCVGCDDALYGGVRKAFFMLSLAALTMACWPSLTLGGQCGPPQEF